MLRFMWLIIVVLMATPVIASDDAYFNPDESKEYLLTNGLVLHGWSDVDYPDYRLQKVTDHHYKMDLSIVNDIREIMANNKHRIIGARFRSSQSVAISGDGPTWALTDIQTPFSPWKALPVADNGRSVSLVPINHFKGSALSNKLSLKEVFPDITPERIYAAERAYRKIHGDGVYPEYLTLCIESLWHERSWCEPYVYKVELELIIKDAPPVTIVFTHIPGC
jgi:hypothetical protein